VLVDPDRVERAGYEHRTADDAALKPAAPAAPFAGLDKSATQTTPAAPSARATQDQEAQPV
jgi:hypothetical protein